MAGFHLTLIGRFCPTPEVWSGYCARSFDNAKQFLIDSLRDGIGLFQAMESLLSLAPQNMSTLEDLAKSKAAIDAAKQQLLDAAKKIGISNLDHRYKDVRDVVRELGESQAAIYKNGNVLFSKFVHPTALIVNTTLDPAWTKLMLDGFFEIAVRFASDSLDDIARANL